MTTETLTLEQAEALATAALIACNTSAENAAATARALVRAQADGQGGHGISRVPSYAVQARAGKVDGHAVPRIEDVREGLFRVDAGFGFAYPAFELALPELERRVQTTGIAACAVYRSHHFGVAGHSCEWLAERGMIGITYGNAPKAMALWGSTRSVLGTNPIAFAAPMEPAPLVIDMATTTVARGKILAAREAGKTEIPEGWALGPDGEPTTDPVTALAGTVAPMGGAKGAALALMVEVMSAALAGAAFGTEASSLFDAEGEAPNLGQVVLAIDATALSGGAFAGRMADLAAIYAETDGARLPGSRRLTSRAKAAEEGVTLDATLLAKVRALLD
ncbi:Ldh family oxidoreductase [Pontivivens insulae]|uniref:(2R)-3-sulfolactate dehydrogenase (NADP(+)) n=1 Tax=Pontivivens insulae TaxID=1639689 RepID=A0A2R8AB93_9RHOB|nr:Ldh family oxidoreductase [Pontivivens insulae]RED11331.1 (2R)-3-sulfolactate dehydrogenase (NADP+) [Pontivivens insulae]SPF29496.1 (2R)-3-sulfolactate dehydrogenase (NADP(+)) [Pontivivens insulae]